MKARRRGGQSQSMPRVEARVTTTMAGGVCRGSASRSGRRTVSTGGAGGMLPRYMHRASRTFLDDYLEGDLPVAEFRRLFSLPNSEYLGLGRCLIALHE